MRFELLMCALTVVMDLWSFPLVQSAQTGNSLVTCAACQGLQAQIDNWSCDINCQVAKGSSDDVTTNGVIAELLGRINQLEESLSQVTETVKGQNQTIRELKNKHCAFAAQGYNADVDSVQTIDDSAIVFEKVDLNTRDGYNVTTGVFTATIAGTYTLSTHARTTATNYGHFSMKKNDDVICDLWVTANYGANIISCSTVIHLDIGDKVKVTGANTNTAAISVNYSGFSGILVYAD